MGMSVPTPAHERAYPSPTTTDGHVQRRTSAMSLMPPCPTAGTKDGHARPYAGPRKGVPISHNHGRTCPTADLSNEHDATMSNARHHGWACPSVVERGAAFQMVVAGGGAVLG